MIMATGPTRGVITYRSQQNMLSWAKNSNLSSINLHVCFNDDDALTYSVNWSMQLKVNGTAENLQVEQGIAGDLRLVRR